jgi:GNAT superfamily N-acetyltransferase
MEIIKDTDVNSILIKRIRQIMLTETDLIKKLIGINSSNIVSEMPIKNRDFHIWVYINGDRLVGFVTFVEREESVIFIRALYVTREHRNQGIGAKIMNDVLELYPKIECRVNNDNFPMYSLLRSLGFRGEKSIVSFLKPRDSKPIWWSNYKTADSYL